MLQELVVQYHLRPRHEVRRWRFIYLKKINNLHRPQLFDKMSKNSSFFRFLKNKLLVAWFWNLRKYFFVSSLKPLQEFSICFHVKLRLSWRKNVSEFFLKFYLLYFRKAQLLDFYKTSYTYVFWRADYKNDIKIGENSIFLVKIIKIMVFCVYLRKYAKFRRISWIEVVDLTELHIFNV